jgi:FkbM family methyltransferase
MIYSQHEEQYYVSSYFGQLTGCFLDLGCNDGITLSNTYSLVLKGWSGVLVDGSPAVFERLIKNMGNNRNVQMLNYLIGDHDGNAVLHESGELLGTGDISLVSSIKESEVRRWDSLDIPFKDVTVSMLTFKSLMEISKYKTFDMISVDLEGCEPEVVPQIDFEGLGCRLAIIEWNGRAGEFYDKIMFDHGMKCIHVNAENRIYTL